jgi:DNA polymerase I
MKLMVLDGNSLAYRAFFALPTDMATASGQVTNSVYGFCTMLLSLLKEQKPDGVVVVFDRKEPTFRHVAAPEYKAQREAQPDILYQQMDIIKEVLAAMGIATIDAAGFEGDDLIATVATMAERDQHDLLIVTGDRDSYQLVKDPYIRVLYNKRGVSDYALYNELGIFEKTGVTPMQYPDYAALRGDSSDNLDGVPGVGEKTAAKLISKYKSLKAVFDAADEQTPKLRQSLHENRDRVIRNAELMVLRRDAPVDIELSETAPRPNLKQIQQMFEILEFKNMFAKAKSIFADFAIDNSESVTIDTQTDSTTVESASLEPIVVVCGTLTETITSLEGFRTQGSVSIAGGWLGEAGRSELDGVAMTSSNGSGAVAWIPLAMLEQREVLDLIGKFPSLYMHHAKPLLRWVLARGVDIETLKFDTAIAAYLLDPSDNRFVIDEVLSRYTNWVFPISQGVQSDQLDFGSDNNDVSRRAACEALAIKTLTAPLTEAMEKQGVGKLYFDVELPLVRVLAKMEHVGIGVNKKALTSINEHLIQEVQKLTGILHGLAGREFNLNSPTQLREILFEERKLQPGKKTKTGFSTDAATLEKIRDQWPEFIDPLMRYREFEKLRSTYGEGLLQSVAKDGRIHATFNQMVARTGRLSSDQPNLHNIPVRSDEGKVFRTAFVPSDSNLFMVADYNQIELRCIAHLANDPGLIEAFTNSVDVHAVTAARVFGVETKDVTSAMRAQAKMVSYGLAYGMEAFGLSQRLAIGVDEATKILDAYFIAFPNVRRYMDETVAEARKRGYTVTLFGRRRPIPELNNPNFRIRQAGERQAMNAGIQGLAADIFKVALVRIDEQLTESKLESRVILQVHDEVIIEAPEREREQVNDLVLAAMKNAASLSVPLEVNAAWGETWADAKA